MILHLQPNDWSCLPTAFGMCLNIVPSDMFRLIGHDGSQVLFPGLPEPHCRRAFHIQECIDICIQQLLFPVEIQKELWYEIDGGDLKQIETAKERFNSYLSLNRGVLVGRHKDKDHAVAWDKDSGKCFDPVGYKYNLSEFDPVSFYALY